MEVIAVVFALGVLVVFAVSRTASRRSKKRPQSDKTRNIHSIHAEGRKRTRRLARDAMFKG